MIARASVAFGLLLAVGCTASSAPARFRLETGGERVEDIVVWPAEVTGKIHSGEESWRPALVVASGEEFTVPRSWRRAFSNLVVHVHHPDLVSTTGGPAAGGVSAIVLQSWADLARAGGAIGIGMARRHLETLRSRWLPAFPEGERGRLRKYLPALERLCASAALRPEDQGRWATVDAGRVELDRELHALEEAMR